MQSVVTACKKQYVHTKLQVPCKQTRNMPAFLSFQGHQIWKFIYNLHRQQGLGSKRPTGLSIFILIVRSYCFHACNTLLGACTQCYNAMKYSITMYLHLQELQLSTQACTAVKFGRVIFTIFSQQWGCSLAPRPHPAFRHLQFACNTASNGKLGGAWEQD